MLNVDCVGVLTDPINATTPNCYFNSVLLEYKICCDQVLISCDKISCLIVLYKK